MGLDLGGTELLDTARLVSGTGYRTAETGQNEIFKYDKHGANTNYEEIYTVPTGKTFFVTDVLIGNEPSTANDVAIATGAAASEVDFMFFPIASLERIHLSFQVQMRFTSGTRISWLLGTSVSFVHITLIGFEE